MKLTVSGTLLEVKQALSDKFADLQKQHQFMKDYIPDELEKKYFTILKQIKEANDAKKLQFLADEISALSTEIGKVAGQLQQEQTTKDLLKNEKILWSFETKKGFFNRKVQSLSAVTNHRVFIRDYERDTISAIPINLIGDVVVMNKHRASQGTRIGNFAGYAHGHFGGTSFGMSSSQSKTIGDVCIMVKGETKLTWQQVSDPDSVRRLILSIKKQTKV